MRSLVLSGARRTMTLVFFGMLARILIGATLGLLAGWARGSWFDRAVSGATAIWAAFPATLFAMIVIQALGIQQGMWVFVVAISIVGWGEVAQIVRAHVAALKPQPFIESGRSIGARPDQILFRHPAECYQPAHGAGCAGEEFPGGKVSKMLVGIGSGYKNGI